MFAGNPGDWDTYPAKLESNPDSKPFNCKYYPVPIINKDNFCKDLQQLVKIEVLTPLHQYQYGTPFLIISKKEGTVRFITDYDSINPQLVSNSYPLTGIV